MIFVAKTALEKARSWPYGTFVKFFCVDKQRWIEGAVETACIGNSILVKENGAFKETSVDIRSISEVEYPI